MNIPEYVKKAGPAVVTKWGQVYELYGANDPAEGELAANLWLQRNMQQFIAATKQSREVIRFTVQTGDEFIKRTDDGEEYITAMLEDVHGDSDGVRWSPAVLQAFADEINRKGIIGDVDHEAYDEILNAGISDDTAQQLIQQKRGIAKGVKAVFQDGKLWVRALIDKRYKKLIQNAKGVSLEAVVTKDDEGRVTDGKLLGFTFAVNGDMANPRAVIV
jgi:hypothetical protein